MIWNVSKFPKHWAKQVSPAGVLAVLPSSQDLLELVPRGWPRSSVLFGHAVPGVGHGPHVPHVPHVPRVPHVPHARARFSKTK